MAQATPSLRTDKARAGLAGLVEELAPGGRLLRTERLRGGLGCRMDRLRIERADGARFDVSLRRFYRRDRFQDPDRAPTEFEVLQLLEQADISAPRALLLDAAGDLFDCPAMVISFLPGAPLLVPENAQVWTEDLARTLLGIHAITPDRYDLSRLPVKLHDMLHEGIEKRRDAVAESKEDLARENSRCSRRASRPHQMAGANLHPRRLLAWQHGMASRQTGRSDRLDLGRIRRPAPGRIPVSAGHDREQQH